MCNAIVMIITYSISVFNVSQLWDLTSGKLLHDFKSHTAASTCVEFHPKEFLLATASNDRFVFDFFVNEQCGERKKCCFVAINVQFNILLQKR